jgi:hypothetical protein
MALAGRPAKVLSNLLGIEAQTRAAAGAESPGTELIGVVIHPAPTDTPPLRNFLGGDQLPARRRCFLGREDLGET